MENIKDSSFRVLLVDDSPVNIDVLNDILSDYTRYVALCGEKALQLANSEKPPDLILLDVMMPGMDGFEVCKKLKSNKSTEDIPVIFITSMRDAESIVKGFEIGAVDYITKPFNKCELLSRVATHLELKKSHDKIKKHKNDLEMLVSKRTAELVVAKERAEESDRLKTAFLKSMSHEIRTPMNAIVGFSDLLNDPDIAERDKKGYCKYIVQNTNILLSHIDNILDQACIVSNESKIQKKECNINIILDELKETFTEKKNNLNKENIDLIVSKPDNVNGHIIFTDPQRIKQIFSKIIDNALKFTEEGFIKFGYFLKDQASQNIKFFVEDTGIGLSQDQQDNIFKSFRKIENKNKLYSGVGLGLAISKSLINLLGGEIWVESVSGRGSIFNFTISTRKVDLSFKTEYEKNIKN